jgi:hypothetical protein
MKCLFITLASGGEDYDEEAGQRRSNPRKRVPSHFAHLLNARQIGTLRRKIVRILQTAFECLDTLQLWVSDKSVMRREQQQACL